MGRLSYLIKEAFANIRLNRTTTLIAVATTALTLACFGVFLLLYLHLRGLTRALQEDVKVMVYLEDGASDGHVSDLQRTLNAQREVAAISHVSKEQALADFREQFPSEQSLLQGLGENPLPASLVVTIAPAFRSSESVRQWAERVKTLPGVAEVQYNRDWLERLAGFIQSIELASVAIGTLLAAASITIIASTIRLTLYARREEIEIMRLIGATGLFIRIPYLVEGAVLGALGGALALSLLKAGFEFFKRQLGPTGTFLGVGPEVGFFPSRISLLIVLAGLLLGSAGSLVSLLTFERGRR
jgi:cell division transport system permease protein